MAGVGLKVKRGVLYVTMGGKRSKGRFFCSHSGGGIQGVLGEGRSVLRIRIHSQGGQRKERLSRGKVKFESKYREGWNEKLCPQHKEKGGITLESV